MDMSASVDEMEVKNVEALASNVVEAKCDASNKKDCTVKMDGAEIDGKGVGSITRYPVSDPVE